MGPVGLKAYDLSISAPQNQTFQNGPSLELTKKSNSRRKWVPIPTKFKAHLAPLRLLTLWNFQCPKWAHIPTKSAPKSAQGPQPIWALGLQGPDVGTF